MSNLRREILSGADSRTSLAYISDVYVIPGSAELCLTGKYYNTIAKGTGSSYTYPRAMYTYSVPGVVNEQITYPMQVYTDGATILWYDPDNSNSFDGFYCTIKSNTTYDVDTIKSMMQGAEEHNISLSDHTTWEGYEGGLGVWAKDPVRLQVYPPVIYSPVGSIQRLFNQSTALYDIQHSACIKLENQFAYLMRYPHSQTSTAYLFKNMFKITYSTNSDMSDKQTRYIPSFNPATESNSSTKYAYIDELNVIIKDPVMPNLPIEYTYSVNTWPTGELCSYFKLELNETLKESLQNKYQTHYAPLAYNINSSDTTGTHILRRQCSIGSGNVYTTTYTPGQSGLSYYKFYKCSNNQPLSSSNYVTFMPNDNVGETDPMTFRFTLTYYGNINQYSNNYGNTTFYKGTIMNIFLINVGSSALTNDRLQGLSKVIKKSNMGQNSSFTAALNFVDSNEIVHGRQEDYLLALHPDWEAYQLPRHKTRLRPVVTQQYGCSTENFEVYSIPSAYSTGEAINIPAFKLYSKNRPSTYVYSIAYTALYNNGNGRNLFYLQTPASNTTTQLHTVSYVTNDTINEQCAYAPTGSNQNTYYIVAASFAVPFKNNNTDAVFLDKGILFSPEQIYTKKETQSSSGFWTVSVEGHTS